MKIRAIQEKDDAALYGLIRQILQAENLALPGTAYYDKALSNLTEFYYGCANAAYFVLVDDKDQVAGGVGIAPFVKFDKKICELQKLYLAPAYRGQGLSNLLMDTALDFAAKHYQKVYLETHTNLQVALKLYEKYHFQKLPAPLSGSEHSRMNVWLLKDLSAEKW